MSRHVLGLTGRSLDMYWINPAFSPTSGSVNSFTIRVVCPMVWCSNRRRPSPFCLPSVIHLPTCGNQPTDSGQFRTPGQGYSSAGTEALWDGTPTCCRPKGHILEMVFPPLQCCRWCEVPEDWGSHLLAQADLQSGPTPTDCPCRVECPCSPALA